MPYCVATVRMGLPSVSTVAHTASSPCRASRASVLSDCASLVPLAFSLGTTRQNDPFSFGVAVQGLGLDRCGLRRCLPALVELQLTLTWFAPLEAYLAPTR
jgi:hypothetical protein